MSFHPRTNNTLLEKKQKIVIVGGGLAGSEAAWQALKAGIPVTLYEARPKKMTPAHRTSGLAELVCSNSLKSECEESAAGVLKEEMKHFNSLILEAAQKTRVPAGQALAVDRELFSAYITKSLEEHPLFTRISEEITKIPTEEELEARGEYWIIASGPLTSEALSEEIRSLCFDEKHLYFYDAIAPVIDGDTINMDECFWANRYDAPEEEEKGDYLNIPLSKQEYETFIDEVIVAKKIPLHSFENPVYFECCLPIEVMAERGRETLRFGPMKPVGIKDPKTGHRPWANIQLRQENKEATMFSMVGFQSKMSWGDQKRIFGALPALSEASFLRYGSIHRNTYIESPKVLTEELSFKKNRRVFPAGQITGVEGYLESAAIGLMISQMVSHKIEEKKFSYPPKESVSGSLINYLRFGTRSSFTPMNVNLGLLPEVPDEFKKIPKKEKKLKKCEIAREFFREWEVSIFSLQATEQLLLQNLPLKDPLLVKEETRFPPLQAETHSHY